MNDRSRLQRIKSFFKAIFLSNEQDTVSLFLWLCVFPCLLSDTLSDKDIAYRIIVFIAYIVNMILGIMKRTLEKI